MDDAKITLPDENTLFRRYLQKLVPDLRQVLLSKGWVLDAGPPRKPTTWRVCRVRRAGVVEPCGFETAQRNGQRDPSGVAADVRLFYCRRQDHHIEICPKRAADVRGDTAKCLADSEMGGRTCNLCNQADHTEEHHRLAVADLLALAGQPGPRSPIAAKPPAESVNEAREREESVSRNCRCGEDCRQWKRGDCPYVHDTKYDGERPDGSPSPRKGDGKRKSGGKGFDRSTMCYQFGKPREEHPDKRYCVREVAAILQPSLVEAQKDAKREGKKNLDRTGKRKVSGPSDRRESEFTILDRGSCVGY